MKQHWIKVKNPNGPAVKREAEEDWGQERLISVGWSLPPL